MTIMYQLHTRVCFSGALGVNSESKDPKVGDTVHKS